MSKTDAINSTKNSDNGYKETINICMIGPRGAGKTSLLATMYKMVQQNLGGKLRFEPLNKEAFMILNDKYINLQKMVDKPAYTRVVNDEEGTKEIQEYSFGLDLVGKGGKRKKITLVKFFDTPGAMTEKMSEELEKRIQESQIIINAIDTGVMMKADILNAEKFNGYARVKRLLEDNAFIDAKNKLVLFTLIKAETWITDRDNKKHVAADIGYLSKKFEQQCQCLTDLFPESASRLGIFCPVETLGCVEFSMITKNDEGNELVHYKRVFGKNFSPRHVQLPLYYAICFTLSEWCKNKGFFARLFSKAFGDYHGVLKVLEEMDAEVIQSIDNATVTPGLYGNRDLLKVNK